MGEIALKQLKCLGFSMGRSIFSSFHTGMAAYENKRPIRSAIHALSGLIADGVKPGCYVSQRRDECAIRGTDADVMSKSGYARQHGGHGVFADTPKSEESGTRTS